MADISIQELKNIKSTVERLQKEANKAEGALEQTIKDMEEQFECSTIKEAEALLKKLTSKTELAKTKFEKALATFKKEWEIE